MLLKELENLVVIILVSIPFIVQLSIDSLKYRAVRYRASAAETEVFLSQLPSLLKPLYLRNLKGIYQNDYEYLPDRVARWLLIQRIVASIIPSGFIILNVFAFVRSLIRNDEAIITLNHLVQSLIISALLVFAWRFGNKIKPSPIT